MSDSRTRIRQDEEDNNSSANATSVIDPKVLAALVTSLTRAINTAVSNATTSQPTSVNTNTYSSAINPCDTNSMNLKTKLGKYQWYIDTKPKPGWGIIGVNV